MSDDIFIKHDKNGGNFQQPFLARVPANGQQPNIAQRVYQVSTSGQQPFTYQNRQPTNVQNVSNAQTPVISQGTDQATYQHRSPSTYSTRSPFIYNIQEPNIRSQQEPNIRDKRSPFTYQVTYQHREPSTYQHRSPFIYQTPTQTRTPSSYQARQPISYDHRSPFTYDHRSPFGYQHRSPSQTPSTYQNREPLIYDHRSPFRSPFTYQFRSPFTYDHRSPSTYDHREPNTYNHRSPAIYDHRSPFTYDHRSPFRSPFQYDHRSPFTYDHRSPSTYQHQSPLTYDHRSPFTYSHASPYIADRQTTTEQTFSWGSQQITSSTTGADFTISEVDYDSGFRTKACLSTEITVNASSGTGGSLSVRLRYGTSSGCYQSNPVTITHSGGLDSLQARFSYVNAACVDNNTNEFAAFLYSRTANIDVGDFNEDGLITGHPVNTSQISNTGTGISNTGVDTGSSAFVEMGRNGFNNTGICSAAMVAAADGGTNTYRAAKLDADGTNQSFALQLRANGDNNLIKTVWIQPASVIAESERDDSGT